MQEQSVFFSIPLEIRHAIYKLSVPFLQEQCELRRLYRPGKQEDEGSIPCLLLVCKDIYNEARPVVGSYATVFLGMEGQWAIRSLNPFRLPLVRHLQIQLGCNYWPSAYGLEEFTKWCGKGLRELQTVHIHYSKPTFCFCNECSVWYRPLGRWKQTDLVLLNELIASIDNLGILKISGHYDKEWCEGLQTTMKAGTQVPKIIFLSNEEATQQLEQPEIPKDVCEWDV